MKKSLLALAALGAFAGAASAQSTVTLFGILDAAPTYTKNGTNDKPKYSLSTDGINSSRLGFRGVEDMGGGLRAGFWIEGALQPDTGNVNGQTWQRRETVSLLGAFGELRMGRDYTPTFWNHTIFDPFGTNGVGSELNYVSTLGSGATTLVRANNTVGYFLPALGGFYGQFMVAAAEGTTGNKYWGGRLGYGAGPINVAGAYGVTKKTGTMVDDFKGFNVGGSYNLGFLTIEGLYTKYKYSTLDQKTALLGVLVPVGAGTIKASIASASGTNDTLKAKQFAVGYQYDLSKRTALYANISSLNNGGTLANGAKFVVNGAPNATSATLGGETSSGYQVGLRHSF